MQLQTSHIPLQWVTNEHTRKHQIRLCVLRLDLIHPYIGGNKYFKLNYNLDNARKQGKFTLLTFGGAYSNHIAATACAGEEFGFTTIGIIRGEEHKELNKTLKFATEKGMKLHFVTREEYRKKYIPDCLAGIDYYLIPEGGSNALGVKGCMEIINHLTTDFDYICCACGTGATLAGVILSLKGMQKAIGFQTLKAERYINREVKKWIRVMGRGDDKSEKKEGMNGWAVYDNYHFGGYAKVKPELLSFITAFEKDTNIPLEPVYTGKMMFGIYDLIEKGMIEKGKTIVAIHTGGMQYV